jgi:uncharacterized membrane protein
MANTPLLDAGKITIAEMDKWFIPLGLVGSICTNLMQLSLAFVIYLRTKNMYKVSAVD